MISSAYEVLGDTQKKKLYDELRFEQEKVNGGF
jgi:DnaJ-class molecular chaperone